MMNGILETASEVGRFMSARDWKFCVIGGLAVQRWGEPRTTLDADFTLLTGWGNEERFVDEILANFEVRIPNARDFALSRRVMLISGSNGTPADISLGALPFEVEMVNRAVEVEFAPRVTLPCCTAEDLFVMKAFASRPGDWVDVEGVANRHRALDVDYILKHLRDLSELKEEPEILARAMRILENRQ
jgi:hypothetical protein